jgi:hypothetical protein
MAALGRSRTKTAQTVLSHRRRRRQLAAAALFSSGPSHGRPNGRLSLTTVPTNNWLARMKSHFVRVSPSSMPLAESDQLAWKLAAVAADHPPSIPT